MSTLYHDTVLLHLERGARRLNDAEEAPELLQKSADQVFQLGRDMAIEIMDAPEFARETIAWSLERVDQITSLWSHRIEVLGAGVHAAAHVLKSTAFFQARAIASQPAEVTDRRTKQGRRYGASWARGHSLSRIAEKFCLLDVTLTLSPTDERMLSEWRAHLDASAYLYGLVGEKAAALSA